MENIRELVLLYSPEIILGMAIAIIILLLLIIILAIRISRMKRRYKLLVRGIDKTSIEDLLIRYGEEIDSIKDELTSLEDISKELDKKLAFAVQKVGFVRYNAFADMGSELSFSIAFLDGFLNGFVLTSIFGRENSICYAKPIKNGRSIYPLSAEEIQSIDRAIRGDLYSNL
ncbi:MAG: DUF4446 family protein [Tissierellia bacterium]|nr:DUF4446 family protein [Tissierellia bacterium]